MKTGHTKKCLKLGAQALTDEELLAVLLRSGSSGSSSLELAGEVLHLSRDKEGLPGLHQLSLQQLKSIRGIGTVKAVQLKCIGELSKRIAVSVAEKGVSFVIRHPLPISTWSCSAIRNRSCCFV